MKRVIFRIVFIVALLVFVGAASYIVYTYIGYKKDADTYQEAVSEYVKEPEKSVSQQARRSYHLSRISSRTWWITWPWVLKS